MIWFIGIAILLCAVMYGYIAWRLRLPSTTLNRLAYAYLFFAWATSLSPIIFHYQQISGTWVDMLTWFVYINMGFFSLLMVAYLLIDVFHISFRAIKPHSEPNPERRRFMSSTVSLGVLGATGGMTGFGMNQALGGALIKEVTVPLGNVPQALQKLKIAQFTDLHVGPMIKRDYVETLVQQMNALHADMIVMTGDLVDGSVARLKDEVAPLANLKAKYKFFITGNHEYYSGAEAWIEEMKRLGFTVLLNEHEILDIEGAKLLMAGVTDYRAHQYIPAHQSSPKKAMQGAPDADVKILLAHQPKSIDEAYAAGFDFQISGHTHGGQYYPWNFIAKMANPYIKGLHLHRKKTWIYVSLGTGYWGPPIRLGNEPEITVFRLT